MGRDRGLSPLGIKEGQSLEGRSVRLRRIRFSVRQLIVVVAVLGVILGAEQMWRRREFCLERAAFHRLNVMFWNGNHIAVPFGNRGPLANARLRRYLNLKVDSGGSRPPQPDYEKLRHAREEDPHIDWHWSVAETFERAANRPWEALPAEPECPGFEYFYRIDVKIGKIRNP